MPTEKESSALVTHHVTEVETLAVLPLSAVRAKLARMKELEPNWDSYGAKPPAREVLTHAERFAEMVEVSPSWVAPSVMGGVGFSFWEQDKEVYVEFINNHLVAHALCSRLSQEETGEEDSDYVEAALTESGLRSLATFVRARIDG